MDLLSESRIFPSDHQQQLENQFRQRATEAYHAGQLKIALVYLRKLTQWDIFTIEILIQSAYRLWQDSYGKADVDERELEETIQSAFTLLLNGSVPYELLQPKDYLMLTHIYCCQGNLISAFQILSLATARGHMESAAIIIQMWAVLTRLNREKDANDCMMFLLSSITIVSSKLGAVKSEDEKDSIPMLENCGIPFYFAYLHVINYLMNQTIEMPKTSPKRLEKMKEIHALLAECYFLATGDKKEKLVELIAWFNDYNLWMDVGSRCEGTTFFLLGEDSYWEAFRRRPLDNISLQALVKSMVTFHREEDVPRLLTKAITLNPWNIYCREALLHYEGKMVKVAHERRWKLLFEAEERELCRIQALIRGHQQRGRWPIMQEELIVIKEHFFRKMALADRYYEKFWLQYISQLIDRWLIYNQELRELKYISATKIQTWMRKILAVMKFRKYKRRVASANGLFLTLVNNKRNRRCLQALHQWHDYYRLCVKRRAATILSDVIWLHGYNQYLVRGMNELLKGLRVHNKHVKKRAMAFWVQRYKDRQVKHATVTIRFFIRGIYQRKADQQAEEELVEVEQMIVEKQTVAFQSKYLTILREMWSRWRKKYLMIAAERKVQRMIVVIQHAFYRKKAVSLFRQRRVRLECQQAYAARYTYLWKERVFKIWRCHQSSRVIQRAVRCYQARRRLKRLQLIHEGVGKQRSRLHFKIRQHYFGRYRKFVYLARRERLRAVLKIVIVMRKHAQLTKLRVVLKRKMRYGLFAHQLNKIHTAHSFRQLRFAYLYRTKYQSLSILFKVLTRLLLKWSFSKLIHQTLRQSVMKKLRDLLIRQHISNRIYPDAYQSVRVIANDAGVMPLRHDHKQNLPGMTSDSEEALAVWEQLVVPKKRLLSIETLHYYKAFASWMAVFRLAQHYRRGNALHISRGVMEKLILQLGRRREAVARIQPFWRGTLARMKFCLIVSQMRRRVEFQLRKRLDRTRIVLHRMLLLTSTRHASRQILQRAVRVFLSGRRLNHRRRVVAFLQENENKLNRSEMQKYLCRQYFQFWYETLLQAVLDKLFDIKCDFDEYASTFQRRVRKGGEDLHHDEEEDNDEGYSSNLKAIERYHKRLDRQKNKSALTTTTVQSTKSSKSSLPSLGRNKNHLGPAPSLFPSSSAMFFQSDIFHRTFSQIRSSHIFILSSQLLSQLPLQELQYCLFHSDVVVVQGVEKTMLKIVCECFRGKKVIFNYGRVSDKSTVELIIDLATSRQLLDSVVIDRSKWPLTLPTQRGGGNQELAIESDEGFALVFQHVDMNWMSSLRLARALAIYGEEIALQLRLRSYASNDRVAPSTEKLLSELILDVNSFGWTGLLVILHSLRSYASLIKLTIEQNSEQVPSTLKAALTSLAGHTQLKVLVLKGWFPASIYCHMSDLLEKASGFSALTRLELQEGYQRESRHEGLDEAERAAAIDRIVHWAKIRAYSNSAIGLSVVSDFIQ